MPRDFHLDPGSPSPKLKRRARDTDLGFVEVHGQDAMTHLVIAPALKPPGRKCCLSLGFRNCASMTSDKQPLPDCAKTQRSRRRQSRRLPATHEMKKRYSHVRVEARRAALAGLVPERLDSTYLEARAGNIGKGKSEGPQRTGKPLNNTDVLDMFAVGLSAKVIVAKIARLPGTLDTSTEVLKKLKASGVHDSIILAMVQAS